LFPEPEGNRRKMNLDRIVETINTIPTLPSIYQNLINVMEDPNATSEDVAKVISYDQAASFTVLRIANSPLFGLTGNISSISQAVMHLGFIEIRNIVLALSVINLVKTNNSFPKLTATGLWKHSIAVGTASKLIAQTVAPRESENAFLGGILHDIGKLILMIYFEKDYQKVFENFDPTKEVISEAEKRVLGITHAEIGGMVAEYWEQPDLIVNMIKYHNTGFVESKFHEPTAIVHLGDIYARAMGLGNPGDNMIPEPNHKIWEHIELPNDFFVLNITNITISYESIVSMLLK
jgi:putative nucleotidyltransferase with HDIG domain